MKQILLIVENVVFGTSSSNNTNTITNIPNNYSVQLVEESLQSVKSQNNLA